jgi:hypothetical protein
VVSAVVISSRPVLAVRDERGGARSASTVARTRARAGAADQGGSRGGQGDQRCQVVDRGRDAEGVQMADQGAPYPERAGERIRVARPSARRRRWAHDAAVWAQPRRAPGNLPARASGPAVAALVSPLPSADYIALPFRKDALPGQGYWHPAGTHRLTRISGSGGCRRKRSRCRVRSPLASPGIGSGALPLSPDGHPALRAARRELRRSPRTR